MGKVVLDITMSLDGFITAPNDDVDNPLGVGGMRLHDWIFGGKSESGTKVTDEWINAIGAAVIGQRTYHIGVNTEDGWDGGGPFGNDVPTFVLTHHVPQENNPVFTFVTDGIESALKQAQAVAGDKNVTLMGAQTAQQYLKAGLVDEMQIHIVPVLLGDGRRLFENLDTQPIELESTRVIESPGVTHLRFRVVK